MLTLTEKPKGKEKSDQAPRLPFYIAKRKECSLWREREGKNGGGGKHKIVNLLGRPCQLSAKGC